MCGGRAARRPPGRDTRALSVRPRPGNEHRRDLRLGIYRLTLASVELALSAALTGLAGTS